MSKRKIKVAVLQCVYRGDDVNDFRNSMKSNCLQASGDIEVCVYLCVDGYVSPEVFSVIDEYSGIIKVKLINAICIGLAKSLNNLISSLGDEDYIARMDSDDYSLPDRFKMQISFMESNEDIDACGGAIYECYVESGRKVLRSYPSENDVYNSICKGVPIAHPTAMFRRGFFDKFGKYPDSEFNQDIGLWFQAILKGAKLGNISDPVLEYKICQKFAARRSFKKAVGEFLMYINGIYRLHGFTTLLIYPFGRFLFRMLPGWFVSFVYASGMFRNGSARKMDF